MCGSLKFGTNPYLGRRQHVLMTRVRGPGSQAIHKSVRGPEKLRFLKVWYQPLTLNASIYMLETYPF